MNDGCSRTDAVRTELQDVVSVMQSNIDRVVTRGDSLAAMQAQSDQLAASTTQFRTSARRVTRQMWWKNFKIKISVILITIILIGLIIWAGVVSNRSGR